MRISTDVLQRTRRECKAFGFVQCALSNKAIDWERHIESHKSSVRCKVEHVFRIIKCQFGYRKTAYRGLMKNKIDSTLCSFVQIYMLLQLPGENFLQAEIGVVFPLSTDPIFSVKSNCHNCQEC